MNATELRPNVWLSNPVEVKSVTPHGGVLQCHVLLYGQAKDLSPEDLCGQFGARRAEADPELYTRPDGGGATMRFAWLTFGPNDTVLVD